MNQSSMPEINALHSSYQTLTGIALPLSFLRERAWLRWVKAEMTTADLALWVKEVRHQQSRGSQAKLTFRCLVGTGEEDMDMAFERAQENIVELRRMKRGHVPDTDRASVLRTTGRSPAVTQDAAKLVGEVIQKIKSNPEAAEKAFRELQKMKETL